MNGNTDRNRPDNTAWNLLAAFLLVFSLGGLRFVFADHQDAFHYAFNALTVSFVAMSAMGVFAYANNRAVFSRAFWSVYFYAYGLFMILYNVHCLQEHGSAKLTEASVDSVVNAGFLALLTLYVLYRYAFVEDSF